MNGSECGLLVADALADGRKIEAIKALRKLDTTYNHNEGRWCISLLDAKLFIESLIAGQPTSTEVEFEQYKKLRYAGFDIADAVRIVETLR